MNLKKYFAYGLFLICILYKDLNAQSLNLDPKFKMDGIRISSFENWGNYQSLCVQEDQKIVLAGSARFCRMGSSNLFVARILPNGVPDSTFGINGSIIIPFTGGGPECMVKRLEYMPDGKIQGIGNGFIFRILKDGERDISFGVNGIKSIPYAESEIFKYQDAYIFHTDTLIYHYDSNGNPKSPISNTVFKSQLGGTSAIVAVQSDGKMIVTFFSSYAVPYPPFMVGDPRLKRLNIDGSLDNSFDISASTYNLQVAVAHNDKICAVYNDGIYNGSIFFYDENGHPESSKLVANDPMPLKLFPDSHNGFYYTNYKKVGTNNFKSFIYKYDDEHNLDQTFGYNGIIQMNEDTANQNSCSPNYPIFYFNSFFNPYDSSDYISSAISDFESKDLIILKRDKKGHIDSLSQKGRFFSFGGAPYLEPSSIEFGMNAPDYSFAADSSALIFAGNDLCIRKIDKYGETDTTFNKTGKVCLDINKYNDYNYYEPPYVHGIALDSLRRIYVVGSYISRDSYVKPNDGGYAIRKIFLVRIKPDGIIDKSFADEGYLSLKVDSVYNIPLSIKVVRNNIVITGIFTPGNIYSYPEGIFNVILDDNGNLNTSFNGTGFVRKKVLDEVYSWKVLNSASVNDRYIINTLSYDVYKTDYAGNINKINVDTTNMYVNPYSYFKVLGEISKNNILMASVARGSGTSKLFVIDTAGHQQNFGIVAGKNLIDLGEGVGTIASNFLEQNNQFIVCYNRNNGVTNQLEMIKFNSSGQLDFTFGVQGKLVLTDNFVNPIPYQFIKTNTSKVYLGGSKNGDCAIWKFNTKKIPGLGITIADSLFVDSTINFTTSSLSPAPTTVTISNAKAQLMANHSLKGLSEGVFTVKAEQAETSEYCEDYIFKNIMVVNRPKVDTATTELNTTQKEHGKIYPNPASSIVRFKNIPFINLKIYNQFSQLVMEHNRSDDEMNVSGLAVGLYIIKFSMYDHTSYTEKLLIMR